MEEIMKQEFEMTQQEMDDFIAINKNRMPVMKIGNVITGMDLREKINAYWGGLADKYGFKQMTVEPSSKGELFFLAEPNPIVKPKTPKQKADIPYDTLLKTDYLPPDNGDVCWEKGKDVFSRKEVAYLLYTQRVMISNDLKTFCGKDLTTEMFDILNEPRQPEW